MKNDYSWVADKKREAMAAKLQRRGMPRYAQRAVSERYGVSYTGLGDDGVLDRSAPAGFDDNPSPHVYHEGETRVATPEGSVYLNADVTQGAGLAGPGQQSQNSFGSPMPGFASGGGVVGVAGAPRFAGAQAPRPPQYSPPQPQRPVGVPSAFQQQPQQQASAGPAVRGWRVDPRVFGNSGASAVAAPPQQPQQPVAPLPQALPQPPVQMPGYASGGGQVQVIGYDGGLNKQYGGANSGDASSTGSQPASPSAGSAGARGAFSRPINTAVRKAQGAFGAATDFLRQSGAQAVLGGRRPAPAYQAKKQADQNNGVVVNGAAPPSEAGTEQTVQAPEIVAPPQQTYVGRTVATPEAQTVSAPEIVAPPQQTYAGQTVTVPGVPPAPELRATPQQRLQGLTGEDRLQELKRLQDEGLDIGPYANSWEIAALSGLDAGSDPGDVPVNNLAQGYLDQASTPLTSSQFLRDPYAERRIDDMRQEGASRQAYLQHQQAMNGTDANAAWAQSAMERAGHEESINDFASAAASQQWDRMTNLAKDWLNSDDPGVVAKGAQMMNFLVPGSGVNFTGLITAANAKQHAGIMDQAVALGASMDADDVYNTLKSQYGGTVPDDVLRAYAVNGAMTVEQVNRKKFIDSLDSLYPNLSPEEREDYIMANDVAVSDGALRVEYTVVRSDGSTIGTYYTQTEADKAVEGAGGQAAIHQSLVYNPGYSSEVGEALAAAGAAGGLVEQVNNGTIKFSEIAHRLTEDERAAFVDATPETEWRMSERGKSGRDIIPEFDDALESGRPIVIAGKLYYVKESVNHGKKKENRGVTYTLVEVGVNKPVTVTTHNGGAATSPDSDVNAAINAADRGLRQRDGGLHIWDYAASLYDVGKNMFK